MRKKAFTLLEVMLAISLLLIASSAIFWNIHQAIKRYRFSADMAKIRTQFQSCYHLALNTGNDFQLDIKSDAKHLRLRPFSTYKGARAEWVAFEPMNLFFNGREIEEIQIFFSPTGKIEPAGVIEFTRKAGCTEISLPEYFGRREIPDEEGPIHPDDAACEN